jgi:hypothetical protein
MMQPMVTAVLQEVEAMQYLPGYRLNVFYGDTACTAQDAAVAAVRLLEASPTKHAEFNTGFKVIIYD